MTGDTMPASIESAPPARRRALMALAGLLLVVGTCWVGWRAYDAPEISPDDPHLPALRASISLSHTEPAVRIYDQVRDEVWCRAVGGAWRSVTVPASHSEPAMNMATGERLPNVRPAYATWVCATP